jgi:hypothetical protein
MRDEAPKDPYMEYATRHGITRAKAKAEMLAMMYGVEPETLSLAQKLAAMSDDRPWAELNAEKRATSISEAKAAIDAGEAFKDGETRVKVLLPRSSACGAVPAVVSALREITDAGVINDASAIEVRIGGVSSVTVLVSRRSGKSEMWGPAPWPVAFVIDAVANWAIRKDPKQ